MIEAGVYHTRQGAGPQVQNVQRGLGDSPTHIGRMQNAGRNSIIERHNQVAGIVCRNICNEYGVDPPKSRWETPQKVIENNRAKLLWDFQIQTDRKVLANQPDIVIVDKQKEEAVET